MLLIPAGTYLPGETFRGRYSYCLTCRKPSSVCAVWFVNTLKMSDVRVADCGVVGFQYEVFSSNVPFARMEVIKHVTASIMHSDLWSDSRAPRTYYLRKNHCRRQGLVVMMTKLRHWPLVLLRWMLWLRLPRSDRTSRDIRVRLDVVIFVGLRIMNQNR